MDVTFAGYRLLDAVGALGRVAGEEPAAADDGTVPPGSIRVSDAMGPGSGGRVRLILLPPIDGDLVRRSLHQARTVEHPHLIPDVEVVEEHGRVAVVAPWTAGGTLDAVLCRRGRLAPGEALTVLRPLTGALTAIGDAGLSHGALLPELVWFDDDGRPRLAGLTAGLALAAAAGAELIVPVGAPHLAPEVARGATPDIRADLFSLGSLALLAVAGRAAWPAENAAEVLVQSTAGLWPEADPAVTTPELALVIDGLLAADPADRPPAAVLQVELRSAGRPQPVDLLTAPDESTVPHDPASVPTPGDTGAVRPVGEASVGSVTPDDGVPIDAPPPAGDQPIRRRHRPERSSGGTARPGAGAPARGAAGRASRRRRRSGRRLTRAVVLAGVALLTGGLAVGAGLWWAAGDEPTTAAVSGAAAGAGPGESEGAAGSGVAAPRLAAVTTADATDTTTALPSPAEVSAPSSLAANPSTPPEPSTSPPAESPAAGPGSAVIDWLAVVRGLDQRRAAALRTVDPALMDEVYVAGAARDTDRALVSDLQRRGLRIDGGTHDITAARVVSAGTTPSRPGSEVTVEIEQSLPAYPVVDASGARVGQTPVVEPARAVVVLRAVEDGFAIVSVRPA